MQDKKFHTVARVCVVVVYVNFFGIRGTSLALWTPQTHITKHGHPGCLHAPRLKDLEHSVRKDVILIGAVYDRITSQ